MRSAEPAGRHLAHFPEVEMKAATLTCALLVLLALAQALDANLEDLKYCSELIPQGCPYAFRASIWQKVAVPSGNLGTCRVM